MIFTTFMVVIVGFIGCIGCISFFLAVLNVLAVLKVLAVLAVFAVLAELSELAVFGVLCVLGVLGVLGVDTGCIVCIDLHRSFAGFSISRVIKLGFKHGYFLGGGGIYLNYANVFSSCINDTFAVFLENTLKGHQLYYWNWIKTEIQIL